MEPVYGTGHCLLPGGPVMGAGSTPVTGSRRCRLGSPLLGRRGCQGLRRPGPILPDGPQEAGVSLVELAVAMAVMLIALSMTVVIVETVTGQASSQLVQGRATETAQVSLDGISGYLSGAVSPLQAYAAEGDTPAGADPPASAGLCWDSIDPGPAPASPLLGTDPSGTTPVPAGSPYPSTTDLVDPASLSIIYAHDYDVQLCAYPPNSTTPEVFEAYLNTSTCTAQDACTVDVVRYGTPASPYSAAEDYHNPSAANAQVVDQIDHVWCDQACQAGTSCWSYVNQIAGDYQAPPSYCSGVTASDESQFTPPLFSYVGGVTLQSAANMAATNLDLYCSPAAAAGSATCDPTVSSSGGGPVCDAADTSPPARVTTDDTACLVDAAISSIDVRVTVVGSTQSTSSTGGDRRGTKIAVDQLVSLQNLVAQEQS